ncbi:MAG TPA: hypothetical protein DCO75_00985, partial [Fibrobacteres bacterium]|nr:hypothetical protein [Fibrobacterota bacterium]
INYESVPAYEGIKVTGDKSGFYEVEKMRFPKKDRKDTIIYNSCGGTVRRGRRYISSYIIY